MWRCALALPTYSHTKRRAFCASRPCLQAPKGLSIADYLPQLGGLSSPSEAAKEPREAAPSTPAAAWCAAARFHPNLCLRDWSASQ